MYLKKIVIKNIKCFAHVEIDFTGGKDIRRWTTLFGKNGLGKSTLLQAIGATLAGPAAVRELLPVAEGWVRRGEPFGEIEASLLWTQDDALIRGWPKTKTPYVARYIVTGDDPNRLPESLTKEYYHTVPTVVPWSGELRGKEREIVTKDMRRLQQTAYAEGKQGWLGCGYGPFRRLSGGAQAADKILYAERISARFVTLFREDAALTSSTEWLIKLHNTARDGDSHSRRALEQIKKAFVAKLFPETVKLEVDARIAMLRVGDKEPVPLHDLSDGYRSMLALGIDLLRWLINAFPEAEDPMHCPGVVLIDELDAHLHPAWQQQIGHWLHEKFPNIQFVVATHSPFIAQVADADLSGTIVDTPTDDRWGGNIVLEETPDGVKVRLDVESVQDLRVDQIFQSPLFDDMDSLYSPKTQEKFQRQQELHRKQQSHQLSKSEKSEYEQLSLWRENIPLLTDPLERGLEQTLQNTIQEYRHQLQEIS